MVFEIVQCTSSKYLTLKVDPWSNERNIDRMIVAIIKGNGNIDTNIIWTSIYIYWMSYS